MKPQLALATCLLTACTVTDTPKTDLVPTPTAAPQVQQFYPQPQGNYAVGVRHVYLTDERQDSLSPSGGPRPIRVKLLYPTHQDAGLYDQVFDDQGHTVAYLASQKPADAPANPAQFDLADYGSWSLIDAPLAQTGTPWPVLFYSHGASMFAEDNMELLEHLASQGYVVVALTHAWVAGTTPLASGEALPHYVPAGSEDVTTPQGFDYYHNQVVPQVTSDLAFVYDWLQANNQSLFQHQLDLHLWGALGYSLGGSAAINLCQQIASCQGAANMDGILLGQARDQGIQKPVLLMQGMQPVLQQPFYQAQNEAHLVTLPKAVHPDFSDMNRWIVGFKVQMDADEMHRITKHYMSGFFAQRLKQQDGALEPWPGTELTSKTP